MRIDPKGTVGGHAALRVRRLVRTLSTRLFWDLKTVAAVLSVTPGEARSLVEALEGLGFAKARRGKGPKTWRTTQRAQSFACATAAKPITRRTAEAALARFLERVDRVNKDSLFLAKVTRVIVFGSYLRADQDRLGDVDVAVELVPKQRDRKRLRELNYRRVAESERQGHRFSGVLDRESWWQLEPFRFLKGRSRAISLHDYRAEKQFVDQVPHRILISPAAEEERRQWNHRRTFAGVDDQRAARFESNSGWRPLSPVAERCCGDRGSLPDPDFWTEMRVKFGVPIIQA